MMLTPVTLSSSRKPAYLLWITFCCGFLMATSLSASEVPWSTANVIGADFIGAQSVFSADIDGDGDTDVLGAALLDNDITWWENTAGDGSAWTEHLIDGDFAGAATVYPADVDGDGDTDVIGAATFGSLVSWWENTAGDGSAWTEHTVDTGYSALSLVATDVDGDGDTDIVGGGYPPLIWWENTVGDGSAWTPHVIGTVPAGPQSIAVADIDGDGDPDVLRTDETANDITWWENTAGDGSAWTEHVIGSSVDGARSVHPADMDGDGDVDVVGAAFIAGTISWWENTVGDGSAWTEHTVDSGVFLPTSVRTADMDADGDSDIVVASLGDGAMWWENTAGDGSAWTEYTIDSTDVEELTVADVDGDGDPDFLAAGGNSISWWANETLHRSAVFPGGQTIDGAFDTAASVSAADVDGDGDTDVLGAAYGANQISWWENTAGDGSAWTEHVIDAAFAAAHSVAAADVDGDGDTDVLGAAIGTGEIAWWENTAGDGSAWTDHTIDAAFNGAISVTGADVDDDGDTDVLCAAQSGNTIAWWENTAGDGSTWTEHTIDAAFDQASSVFASDVDRDGDTDVLGAGVVANSIAWWENIAGDGSAWTEHTIEAAFNGAISVTAADVDGDGDPDAVGAARGADDIAWFENTAGDGSAWTKHNIDIDFDDAISVHATDIDGDGDIDVLGAGIFADAVAWWENMAGDGSTWTEHTIDAAFDGAASVTAADVDGDGDTDVLGGAWHADRITWWENRGGQFALPTADAVVSLNPLEGSTDVLVLTIDAAHRGRTGDGDLEIATFELLFEETPGDPLDGVELNALVEAVRVYHDDGNGTFEPGGADANFHTVNSPFGLAAGVLTLDFVDGEANAQVAYGTDERYFIALDLAIDPGVANPNTVVVTHLTESSSTGEMSSTDIPLALEFLADTSSSTLSVIDVFATTKLTDSADGVCDADCSLREAIIAANAAPGHQTVMLGPGRHELSIAGINENLSLTGDLDITDGVTITAADPLLTIIDGNQLDRVFEVAEHTTGVTFSNIAITGGSVPVAFDNGGGILTNFGSETAIENCIVTGNHASYWGGGILHSGAFMEVLNTTVRNNTADTAGSGILACCEATSELVLSGSTLSDNIGGALWTAVDTDIISSTISANTGDVFVSGVTTVTNSTVFGNDAGLVNSGTINMANSVVQGCSGGITSLGGNIESPGNTCLLTGTGDQPSVAPGDLAISALANNGGPTQTMALAAGSVAIDAGLAPNCEPTDQRGVLRPQANGCDVGAYEVAFVPGGVGPDLHVPFENDVLDSSGNQFDGNPAGGGPLYSPGRIGLGGDFDGVDDTVTFPSYPDQFFGTNDFTIAFWFNLETAGEQSIVSKRGICNSGHWVDVLKQGDRIILQLNGGATSYPSEVVFTPGWHHFAGVREGATIRVYLNGILEDEDSTGAVLDIQDTVDFGIGNSACVGVDGTLPLLGSLDDLRVYSRALDDVEIDALIPRPEITVTPLALAFGDQLIASGATATQAVTITNDGTETLNITSVELTGADLADFNIESDTGEVALAPAATRTVTVEFDPTTAGAKTAALTVVSDDDDEPSVDVDLTGTGIDPDIGVAPFNIAFTPQVVGAGAGAPRAVTITNLGTSDLSIADVSLTGPNAFEFGIFSDSGEPTLSPAASRTVMVHFDPTSTGFITAALTILSDDPDQPSVDVVLSGTSVNAGEIIFYDGFESGNLDAWSNATP